MHKKLVINADDFGFTEKINRGILNTHQNGILTSTSLMANGVAFEQAISMAKDYPDLAVGIHLVLLEEQPILPVQKVPSLINNNGTFFLDFRQFIKEFYLKRIKLAEVEDELRAQFSKVLDAGIRISHIDSHQHLHILPPILKIVIQLALEFNIQWMRSAYDQFTPMPGFTGKGFSFLAKMAKRKILASGLNTCDYFLGTGYSGKLTEKSLQKILKMIPDGISEIMCHPGEEDEQLRQRYESKWGCGWKGEQDALISNQVKRLMATQGIVLTNYQRL